MKFLLLLFIFVFIFIRSKIVFRVILVCAEILISRITAYKRSVRIERYSVSLS